MAPILGIIASGNWAGANASSYSSIATANGNGSSTAITMSSIPSTYTHLQIRGILHSGRTAGTDAGLTITLNSDTAANYSWHRLTGDGASATSSGGGSKSEILNDDIAANNTNVNYYTGFVIDILNYADTNTYKTLRALWGHDRNGAGRICLLSGNWRSTSAVSSLTLTTDTNFSSYSSVALYGIKG